MIQDTAIELGELSDLFGFRLREISCPTKYFEEASSINFSRSVKYGLEVLAVSMKFRLQRMKLAEFKIFSSDAKPAYCDYYELVK
jgi:hypothetical protein